MGRVRLILYDFIISFMWVWPGSFVKMFVVEGLGLGHQPKAEIAKGALSVINMFFFAFLAKVTKGGTYNPLTVFSSAVSGDFSHFFFTVGARIPAQVTFFFFFRKYIHIFVSNDFVKVSNPYAMPALVVLFCFMAPIGWGWE